MYTLLTGHPAFRRADLNDPWFDAISSGYWLEPVTKAQNAARVYRNLSTEVLDLINSIIKPEQNRATIDDILRHPWLNKKDE